MSPARYLTDPQIITEVDLAILFSGGKDSTLATHMAQETDQVKCLVTLASDNPESYMFHTPNIDITSLQADSMGLPLVRWKTEGIKEKEIKDMRDALDHAKDLYGIEGVVTGAIESVYQAERVQRVADELGLWCFNPLWKMDQKKLMYEILDKGYEVVISGVFAYPMEDIWLGRTIDDDAVTELIALSKGHGISPSGEGGEIETTVLDGPLFRSRIRIKESEREFRNHAGKMTIIDAELVEK